MPFNPSDPRLPTNQDRPGNSMPAVRNIMSFMGPGSIPSIPENPNSREINAGYPENIEIYPEDKIEEARLAGYSRLGQAVLRAYEKAEAHNHRNAVVRYVAESIDTFRDDGLRAGDSTKTGHSDTATTPQERNIEIRDQQFRSDKLEKPHTPQPKVGWDAYDKRVVSRRRIITDSNGEVKSEDFKGPNLYRPTTKSEKRAANKLDSLFKKRRNAKLRSESIERAVDRKDPPQTDEEARAMSELKIKSRLDVPVSGRESRYIKRNDREIKRQNNGANRKERKFNKIAAGKDIRGMYHRKMANYYRRKARRLEEKLDRKLN